ncbi:MAG TPA: dihydrofolate reductase family protein [Chitinophagaceae bacterium]|nr:dihydrofolate reductase family protein [Chitinophagaceae bacterium]
MRKVVVYIAMSLDGYIAKTGDDLSFLSIVEQKGEDYGYSAFIKTVDTIIMGRKTYDWVMKQVSEFPHKKQTYIITRAPRPAINNVEFYSGSLNDLVHALKQKEGLNIFVDGGAQVINELMQHQLIDEFIISIIPCFIGEGVRLFKDGRPEQIMELVSAKSFPSGLVQIHYRTKA